MVKFQATRAGDYPTLGFTATSPTAILNGALSNPPLTIPPDATWSVYGGGSAETGITRYVPPPASLIVPTPEVTDGWFLAYSDAQNTYVPQDPADLIGTGAWTAALEAADDDRFGVNTQAPSDVPDAFIANGTSNAASYFTKIASDPKGSHIEGTANVAFNWWDHVEGSNCTAIGKIAHAEGNGVNTFGNDSHGEGNRNDVGVRAYHNVTTGSEDAGSGLGVLQYVLLPATYGDQTVHFPNPLTSLSGDPYGAGAQKDSQGNIYASGFTPATWTGTWPTATVNVENDLEWAMHSYAWLRPTAEASSVAVQIAKAVYSGGQTKVYYVGSLPFAVRAILSSYCPVIFNGNGIHGEGIFTSAHGYGAHAEGFRTDAWAQAAHSEGQETQALGLYSHAEGYQTQARGHASRASGRNAVARRDNEAAHAAGMRAVSGDAQTSTFFHQESCAGAGWHSLPILPKVEGDTIPREGNYHVDAMVTGRQTAGSTGAVGHMFAYKFSSAFSVAADGTVTFHNNVQTLIGRTAAMAGNGTTTAPVITVFGTAPGHDSGDVVLRFDNTATTTFFVIVRSTVQMLLA